MIGLRRSRPASCARGLVAAGLVVALCGGAAARDKTVEEIVVEVDGQQPRSALMEPVDPPARPGPLLIVLHDVKQKPKRMRATARFHERSRLLLAGWTIVHPEGRNRLWNARRLGNDGGPALEIDDGAFLSALVAQLALEGRVDPARVFVAGMGEGGSFALRLACDRPGLVRGVAAVMATAPANLTCAASPPVPTMILNGTEDRIAPWEGGVVPSEYRVGAGTSASVSRTLSALSWRHKCDGYVTRRLSLAVKTRTYVDCAAPLVHYTVTGAGHRWPGGPPSKRDAFGNPANRALGEDAPEPDATAVVAAFFSSLAAGASP